MWEHEARDFTQWLAQPDNLSILAEVLELDLYDVRTEHAVGSFKADILAEDDSGNLVIIENQLEPTNHTHLGQIITYAAGSGAKVIVWIVERARDEHEQAVNWLNDNTTSGVNLFLIQIEAWRIADSVPAPRFNVIARPNDWAKSVKESTAEIVGGVKLQQRAFFERVREVGLQEAKNVKSWQKPLPQHWYNVRLGKSSVNIEVRADSQKNHVAVAVYIQDDQSLFGKLRDSRETMEAELGFSLRWEEQPDRKYSRAGIYLPGDFREDAQADELVLKTVEAIDAFARVVPSYF